MTANAMLAPSAAGIAVAMAPDEGCPLVPVVAAAAEVDVPVVVVVSAVVVEVVDSDSEEVLVAVEVDGMMVVVLVGRMPYGERSVSQEPGIWCTGGKRMWETLTPPEPKLKL